METTTETLSVNGVILNTLAYNVASLTGRWNVPALRTENVTVPGRNGSLRTKRKYHEEGEIVLPLWVKDTDPDEVTSGRDVLYSNIDKLTKLFRPGIGLLEVIHTLPDGTSRRVMAEVKEAFALSAKGRGLATFSVALTVPSVFWESTTVTSHDVVVPYTGTMSGFAGTTAPIEDAIVTITGPVTNPRVEAYGDGAALEVPNWFQYSGTVGAGQTLVVNCGTWSLTGTGGFTPVYANFSHDGDPRWLILQPGKVNSAPGIKTTGSSTSGTTKISVSARRKFLVG